VYNHKTKRLHAQNKSFLSRFPTDTVVFAEEAEHEIANAFSHFSWVHSKGRELVCDIQGVGLIWTDPQVRTARFAVDSARVFL